MKYLKIFGERNTGTNYLKGLISLNLKVRLIEGGIPHKRGLLRNPFLFDQLYDLLYPGHLGWKHAFPDPQRIRQFKGYDETGLVTLTKNPYSFLLSLYKHPYHYKGNIPDNFSEFIRSRWHTLRRENCRKSHFENPVMLWNSKNRAYMALQESFPFRTVNLTYEKLIADPEDIIRHLGQFFDLESASDKFMNIHQSTKGSDKDFSAYREFYMHERWRDEISPEDLGYISRFLDSSVTEYYGYQTL
ncbi:MAG: hypothetical protein R6V49_10820 [Bacteroidales bacterium]